MTVSGLTIKNADRQPVHSRESQTHNSRSEGCKRRRWPRLERCRTKSWCRSAIISACRTARARKQSRRETSRVNMAPAAYMQHICNFNHFSKNELSGRDRLTSNSAPSAARDKLRRIPGVYSRFPVLARGRSPDQGHTMRRSMRLCSPRRECRRAAGFEGVEIASILDL